jgi:hypothetical protein
LADAIEHETAELAVAVAQRAETVHRCKPTGEPQGRCLPSAEIALDG